MEYEHEHRSAYPAPRRRPGAGGAWHAETVWLVRRLWPDRDGGLPGATRLRTGTAERAVRRIGGDGRWLAAGAGPGDACGGGNDHRRDGGGGGQRASEARLVRS